MAWKRGYLCDVQGEVQVAYQPASGLYLLLSSPLLFLGKPTRPHCALRSEPRAHAKFGKIRVQDLQLLTL